ncbi:hypothetical protein [Paenibacillus nasutitermitis]|uniref:Serine/threonine protein kinase n=1 Tax=Paenibacillus nasutitermitis TaxID=1652958 RepID=A0A917DKS1_9BACL|nr:hypothetical protein [Paenibacillus nasutitermitis]GGD48330.1 serine/threonine protein kinase [Paenibacillus nasutitermitis]
MEMFHFRGTADVIIARQRGRDIAKAIGFGLVDQTIVAYIISELAVKLHSPLSGRGYMVIRTIAGCREESKLGIEVRLFDQFHGLSRVQVSSLEKLVDDMDVIRDRAHGTVMTFRKWLVSPLHID